MAPFLTSDISAKETDRAQDALSTDRMESNTQPDNSDQVEDHVVDTEFLIVGAGPAGAALACFLVSYGVF